MTPRPYTLSERLEIIDAELVKMSKLDHFTEPMQALYDELVRRKASLEDQIAKENRCS